MGFGLWGATMLPERSLRRGECRSVEPLRAVAGIGGGRPYCVRVRRQDVRRQVITEGAQQVIFMIFEKFFLCFLLITVRYLGADFSEFRQDGEWCCVPSHEEHPGQLL